MQIDAAMFRIPFIETEKIRFNVRIIVTIFVTVFLAEFGDKTQLATMLFSANGEMSRIGVFLTASAALILSTLIAVLVGGSLSNYINRRVLTIIAGIGFIAIGSWTLLQGIRTPA